MNKSQVAKDLNRSNLKFKIYLHNKHLQIPSNNFVNKHLFIFTKSWGSAQTLWQLSTHCNGRH